MLDREKIKQKFRGILSLDSHPGHIAAGFAVGTFISFTPPVPGVHTGLALGLAFLLRLNKLTCLAGTWINSPLTVVPSMFLSYRLGVLILRERPGKFSIHDLDWVSLKGILLQYSKPLLLGCAIIGFFASIASYFICYWLVVFFRRKDEAMAELTREMVEVGEELD